MVDANCASVFALRRRHHRRRSVGRPDAVASIGSFQVNRYRIDAFDTLEVNLTGRKNNKSKQIKQTGAAAVVIAFTSAIVTVSAVERAKTGLADAFPAQESHVDQLRLPSRLGTTQLQRRTVSSVGWRMSGIEMLHAQTFPASFPASSFQFIRTASVRCERLNVALLPAAYRRADDTQRSIGANSFSIKRRALLFLR